MWVIGEKEINKKVQRPIGALHFNMIVWLNLSNPTWVTYLFLLQDRVLKIEFAIGCIFERWARCYFKFVNFKRVFVETEVCGLVCSCCIRFYYTILVSVQIPSLDTSSIWLISLCNKSCNASLLPCNCLWKHLVTRPFEW